MQLIKPGDKVRVFGMIEMLDYLECVYDKLDDPQEQSQHWCGFALSNNYPFSQEGVVTKIDGRFIHVDIYHVPIFSEEILELVEVAI